MCQNCHDNAENGWMNPEAQRYIGHFHINPNEDRYEQITENLRLIMTELSAKDEWDVAPEIWFINEKPTDTTPAIHAENWDECIFKDDPELVRWDPYCMFEFGNIHPAYLLMSLPSAPKGNAIVLCAESWYLDSNRLTDEEKAEWADGPPNGLKVGDHPKAQECKQLVYCSPEGKIIMCSFYRDTKEIVINSDDDDATVGGDLANAMRRFVSSEEDTWASTLSKLLS